MHKHRRANGTTFACDCAEFEELKSKLQDAEKRIDNLCEALESSGKGHAAKDAHARELESRLDAAANRIKALEATHEHHAQRTRDAESRLDSALATLKAVGDRLGDHYITPLEQTQLRYQCAKELAVERHDSNG